MSEWDKILGGKPGIASKGYTMRNIYSIGQIKDLVTHYEALRTNSSNASSKTAIGGFATGTAVSVLGTCVQSLTVAGVVFTTGWTCAIAGILVGALGFFKFNDFDERAHSFKNIYIYMLEKGYKSVDINQGFTHVIQRANGSFSQWDKISGMPAVQGYLR